MKKYWVMLFTVLVVISALSCSGPKKKILVLLRESSENMNMMIENEFNPINAALTKAGYVVETASENGKEIGTGNSKTKVLNRIDSINIKKYIGIIIPCMAAGGTENEIPNGAIDIIIKGNKQGLIIAAQQSGVLLLEKAGILKNKKYAIVEESKDEIPDGIYQGTGVVQDGNIITSGICPYLNSTTGAKDGTLEMINLYIQQINKNSEI